MLVVEFNADLAYSQLVVFAAAIDAPFNRWTDQHVAQGFSWREGSVAFATLSESGVYTIEVELRSHAGEPHARAIRVIDVPFHVPTDGNVEIGGIFDSEMINIATGTFLLRYEAFPAVPGESAGHISLTFCNGEEPHFEVVVADDELRFHGDLLTTTDAAN